MSIKIVLVEPSVPGNIGATARVMKNFGFNEMVLVNPQTKLSSESFKFALKAADILESAEIYSSLQEVSNNVSFIVGTTAKIVKDKGSNDARIAVSSTDNRLVNILAAKDDVAIVFGREDVGLTNEEIELCDMTLHVPTSNEYKALNLAQAVAIILYSIHSIQITSKRMDYREANKKERDILIDLFTKNIGVLGYTKIREKHLIRRFKNILGRAFVSGKEATSLCGVFSRSVNRILELEVELDELRKKKV